MTRRPTRAGLAVVALAGFALVAPPVAATASQPDHHEPVIVSAASAADAAAAVARVDGRVDVALPISDAVAATVDASRLAALEAQPGVSVVPDFEMHVTGADYGAAAAGDPTLATMDMPEGWGPDSGQGVAVALVDTGVAETPDLAGRVVRGPDLSGEDDGVDRYGHGTFMAGLVAGDGTASAGEPVPHVGVAPGATIVSVKVAGADGSTRLSKLIEGIGWVVVNQEEHNIRALNLSFGMENDLPYVTNPLSGAVEAAWSAGITVVAAAGNQGDSDVTSPGDDPWIVTVGALDTFATADPSDDALASWSGRESFRRYAKPEVAAPGVSVVSLRAPGSTIDTANPDSRVGDAYFRGSGTSMSAALVSGAAAVLTERHPNATPDDVKGALVAGGAALAGSDSVSVRVEAADEAPPSEHWWQRHAIAFNGLGRGWRDRMPWAASRWTASRWTASRWTASRWTSALWTVPDP